MLGVLGTTGLLELLNDALPSFDSELGVRGLHDDEEQLGSVLSTPFVLSLAFVVGVLRRGGDGSGGRNLRHPGDVSLVLGQKLVVSCCAVVSR